MFEDVRGKGFGHGQALAEVQALLRRHLRPESLARGPTESVAVWDAPGRVLAEAVAAPLAIPRFVRAAMDGFALQAEQTAGASPLQPAEFRVVGESRPGVACPAKVDASAAVRIMTGASIPEGADVVVPFEQSRFVQGRLYVPNTWPAGKHVVRVGEEVAAGQPVFAAGRKIRPQDAALAAAMGVAALRVRRLPSVSLLVSGDELLPAGSEPTGWQVVDANSVLLRGLLARDGFPLAELATGPAPILPDDPSALRAALAAAPGDVAIATGGTSAGAEDYWPSLASEVGELAVHGVALRPGGPVGVAFLRDGRVLFLLPGNPAACLAAYDLVVREGLCALAGSDTPLPYARSAAVLGEDIVSKVGRTDVVRVKRHDDNTLRPLPPGATLSSTVFADGFVLVDAAAERLPAGAAVVMHCYG